MTTPLTLPGAPNTARQGLAATAAERSRTSAAAPAGLGRAAEQRLEGGEMAHDPRGGWQFAGPAQAGGHAGAHGPTAPAPSAAQVPHVAHGSARADASDETRLRFRGDTQYPPQSYAHAGTQGTWDDSLGAEGVLESAAAELPRPDEPTPPVRAAEPRTLGLERVPEAVASDAATAPRETQALEPRQANPGLGVALGQGELSQVGRDAHAAQRADPEHSPHFGG